MGSNLTKGLGYALAPKLTFAARHPRKAAAAKAASWAMSQMAPRRRRRAGRRNTMMGIGAAAVAVPVGLWLGRKFLSGEHSDRHTN